MPTTKSPATKPRIFIDADVLFAGAASPSQHGTSFVLLRMAEITLIEAIASQQVVIEAERNLSEKLPDTLPTFRLIVDRSLTVVSDPSRSDLALYAQSADPKDLPILVDAVRERCPWLVTFNVRHYQPGDPSIAVLRPGDLLLRIRHLLAHLQP